MEKKNGPNPWGQYRAKLKRVGDEVILGEPSNDTIGDLQADYAPLLNEVRQVNQYVRIRMRRECTPTADDVIRAFEGKAPFLLGDQKKPGYATPTDIEDLVRSTASNFEFTRQLMAKAWDLRPSVIDTYLKPGRRKK